MTPRLDEDYYAELERQIEEAISLVRLEMSDNGHSEVMEYLDAGEYGLAVERLSEVIAESGVKPSSEVLAIISKVRETMGITEG